MLFDLRSRGRRRTVQIVYLGLAVLMGGGLVLFGVGAGNGIGGLLNAFSNSGGGGSQSAVVNQAETQALRQVKLQPTNPAAWSALVEARWTTANEGSNLNSSTGTYTAAGRTKLTQMTQDWARYLQLTKSPDPNVAILAARGYQQLGNFVGAAAAWEIETIANPSEPKGFLCLAANAYAAKQTRKGDLASAKALTLIPKSDQATIKAELQSAKTSTSIAQSC